MRPPISDATAANWRRLDTDAAGRLRRRANKTASRRRVEAAAYIDDRGAAALLDRVAALDAPVPAIIHAICLGALASAGLGAKASLLAPYAAAAGTDACELPDVGEVACPAGVDLPGYIYQSLLREGERNLRGVYYTPARVAASMLHGVCPDRGRPLLDPCCGSGAILLAADCPDPTALYGVDTDPVAAMICATNLLIKYSDIDFVPQVCVADFLRDDLPGLPEHPAYIVTNPPWGADRTSPRVTTPGALRTAERSSLFLAAALDRLADGGRLCFLLPKALLSVAGHKSLRRLILGAGSILALRLYTGRFDGVFTDYFSIALVKGAPDGAQRYVLADASGEHRISLTAAEVKAGHIRYAAVDSHDREVIRAMESRRAADLSESAWALGIVTGDNRRYLLDSPSEPGAEPVYRGKDVADGALSAPGKYIVFSPGKYRQCAREEYFRAPEKLVYRFISRYPVVAYDDTGALCLNSANILVPRVAGFTARQVCALLNSTLFRYYYTLKFTDIKILKGNLSQLPFPAPDNALCRALDSAATPAQTDAAVYAFYGISASTAAHIHSKLYGNTAPTT